MAACFLRGSSKTTVGLSGRLLPTHPLLLYQLPAIRLCVFLGTNFHPKTTEFFLKCRVLSELIRQQPACKDNTRYQGFLGLSLFGLFSKHLTDAESCLETLGLVVSPCFSLRLWYQNAFRLIWKEKKKNKTKKIWWSWGIIGVYWREWERWAKGAEYRGWLWNLLFWCFHLENIPPKQGLEGLRSNTESL